MINVPGGEVHTFQAPNKCGTALDTALGAELAIPACRAYLMSSSGVALGG